MSPAARVTCPAAGDGKSHAAGDSAATCVHLITSPGVTLYPRLVKTLGCCWGCVLAWHRGPPLADTDEGLQAGPGRSFENNQAINSGDQIQISSQKCSPIFSSKYMDICNIDN